MQKRNGAVLKKEQFWDGSSVFISRECLCGNVANVYAEMLCLQMWVYCKLDGAPSHKLCTNQQWKVKKEFWEKISQVLDIPEPPASTSSVWKMFNWRLLSSYLIFVIFSPRALFLVKFFSTQMCVNRKINFATKQRKLPKKKTNFPSKQCKRQQNTINWKKNEGDFRILHICHVKKFEINPHMKIF